MLQDDTALAALLKDSNNNAFYAGVVWLLFA